MFEVVEYFDSDVLVNAIALQDESKHRESKNLVYQSLQSGAFLISTLVIQEVGYVLSRLGIPEEEIEENIKFFLTRNVAVIEKAHIERAIVLAKSLGYKNINDCIHTAVAESWNCSSLFSYNSSDFRRIQRFSSLDFKLL